MNSTNKLIAFFDLLGFSHFLCNNSPQTVSDILNRVLVDTESSLTHGRYKEARGDLDISKTHCTNFSDSFVFWIDNLDQDLVDDFFKVVYDFNWKCNTGVLPVRGAIVMGDIHCKSGQKRNNNGVLYNVNMVYGKGIIEAYRLSEKQKWAGAIVNYGVLDFLKSNNVDINTISERITKYKVPFQNGGIEFDALKLFKGDKINPIFLKQIVTQLEHTFRMDKCGDDLKVRAKFDNTVEYIKSFLE